MIECAYIWNLMQSAAASGKRFFEIMDMEEEHTETALQQVLTQPKGEIVFNNVRFGYSDDKILMKNININLHSGDKVAIVGPTGAGKTTLVNLLMRFYDIQRGHTVSYTHLIFHLLFRFDICFLFGFLLSL